MPPLRLVPLQIVALLAAAASSFAQTAIVPDAPTVDDDMIRLDDYKVTAATRTEKLASALPVTTTVINSETLDTQLGISSDLGNALAQFIPSYAPARQKLTSNGESFRGRDPLYLLDGIPQSNPLRAGKRESLTIDPFFLEKVEAVHGSSAAQGLGATGGIINFVTRQAPAADGVRSTLELSTEILRLQFPAEANGAIVALLLHRDAPVWRKFSRIEFDARTGNLRTIRAAAKNSAGDQFAAMLAPLHFGFYGATWVKWAYFFGGLSPALLGITGLLIWRSRSSAPSSGIR